MDRQADRAIPRPPQLENRVVGRILDDRRVPSRYDGGKGPSEPRERLLARVGRAWLP